MNLLHMISPMIGPLVLEQALGATEEKDGKTESVEHEISPSYDEITLCNSFRRSARILSLACCWPSTVLLPSVSLQPKLRNHDETKRRSWLALPPLVWAFCLPG